MSVAPMIIISLLYAVQAGMCFYQGNVAGAFVLVGYVIANIGLMATLGE